MRKRKRYAKPGNKGLNNWRQSPDELKRRKKPEKAEANARLEKAKEDAKANKKAIENDYKETLQVIVNDKSEFVKRKANADKWLEEYEANNPEQLDTAEQLKKAEEHNRINALVVDYMAKKKQKEAAEKTARTFEDKLGALAKERETLIATSKLPIAGLSFTACRSSPGKFQIVKLWRSPPN